MSYRSPKAPRGGTVTGLGPGERSELASGLLASPAAEPCAKEAARRAARRNMATISKVRLLAAQVLKAETLSEAHAFARAISDAESDDEPSAKRPRPSTSPRERHEMCYTRLVTEVCKQLTKNDEEGEFKPIAFEESGDKWRAIRPHGPSEQPLSLTERLSEVRKTMLFSDSAAAHLPDGVAVAAPPESRPRVDGPDGCGGYGPPTDSPDPLVNMFNNGNLKISLLLDAEEFANIMRVAEGRGHIGREVWIVCSAWAWALLQYRHDPQGMRWGFVAGLECE